MTKKEEINNLKNRISLLLFERQSAKYPFLYRMLAPVKYKDTECVVIYRSRLQMFSIEEDDYNYNPNRYALYLENTDSIVQSVKEEEISLIK